MGTTVRYVVLTALRDWLFVGLAAALVAIFLIAHFLGSNAVVEQQQMTLVYVAASTRILLHFGLIVFIAFHIRRMFDNREIDVMLSRPISRESLAIAYWLGFSAVVPVFVLGLSLAVWGVLSPDSTGLLWWSGSVLLEAWIVVAFSVFAGLVLRSAVTAVLLASGFYLIGRMAGFFLYYVDPPYEVNRAGFDWVIQQSLMVVSWVMPRLDQLGQSSWLVYGYDGATWLVLLQPLIYIPFLLVAAILDFRKRQF